MTTDHSEEAQQAADAFIAELRHWREVTGYSQKALAKLVGYTPSYISKVENGGLVPSREFAENADRELRAGRVIVSRWRDWHNADPVQSIPKHRSVESSADDPQSGPSTAVLVEHENATLTFRDGLFHTRIRRQLKNVGDQPVTKYLIRIAVDRHPGDPERSNRLYRKSPLTWEELGLAAWRGDEPMTWSAKHDRDAFKEVWLLFENRDGRFSLYPGETTWIEYVYSVSENKWGPWWQRAIRLPTRRLSITVDLPADLDPVVWGMETSMTAEATPFRSQFSRDNRDGRAIFGWSTADPQLHARYRVEWKFKSRQAAGNEPGVETMAPSQRMASLGILQEGDPLLSEPARRFDLPAEAEDARRVVAQLTSVSERVMQVHTFAKGAGIAAPQIGIGRSAAIVRGPDGESVTLLNPAIIDHSTEMTEQYEGCLSFFDVRGMVPRPNCIEVEHQDVEGNCKITEFTGSMARLVAHEVDHLNGILYRSRMREGVQPIPVAQYSGTGQRWPTH